MPFAYYKTIEGPGDVDPDYGVEGRPGYGGGHPSHPIVLPPLPGIYPPPGKPNLPVHIDNSLPSSGHITGWPIFIGGTPEHPISLPPGIWPPLPPDLGLTDKVAILILVLGVGYRWLIVELPPVPQPK